jgi:hypothetical protein
MSSDPDTEDAMARVVDNLTKKFPDVAEDVVAEHVNQAHAPMVEAPLQEYVPVLVEHQAKVTLNELTHDADAETASPAGAEPDAVTE